MREEIPVIKPYNPLDKRNLGVSAATAMLETEAQPLPPAKFIGAGVYAIYYRGDFEPYRTISELNSQSWDVPIYVGKAVPAGARKGGLGMDVYHGPALFNRLSEHFESLRAVQNLNENDFRCRFLVVDDIWIPLTESLLIQKFKPLWNRCIDGFGNHDPGSGRYNQQRSPWDCIHPGREWANKLRPNQNSTEQLLTNVSLYIQETYSNFTNKDEKNSFF